MEPCKDLGGYRGYGFTITQNGKQLYHTGHDYNSFAGSPIYAVSDGDVLFADQMQGFGKWIKDGKREAGGLIIIRHFQDGKNYYEYYGHVIPKVQWGDEVKAGDCIGILDKYYIQWKGKKTKADHLHFCIGCEKKMHNIGYDYNLDNWIGTKQYLTGVLNG